MQVQLLNRTDPERFYINVRNVDGSGSITTGWGVALVEAGASINGGNAIKNTAAAHFPGFCGVAVQDIAINDYGRVCVWGHVASVQISNVGTSLTITRGDTLIPGAVAGTFFSSLTDQAVSTLGYKYVYAATTTVAISALAASYIEGVVRAI